MYLGQEGDAELVAVDVLCGYGSVSPGSANASAPWPCAEGAQKHPRAPGQLSCKAMRTSVLQNSSSLAHPTAWLGRFSASELSPWPSRAPFPLFPGEGTALLPCTPSVLWEFWAAAMPAKCIMVYLDLFFLTHGKNSRKSWTHWWLPLALPPQAPCNSLHFQTWAMGSECTSPLSFYGFSTSSP